MPIKLTVYGFKEWFAATVIASLIIGIGVFLTEYGYNISGYTCIIVTTVLWLYVLYFFRDPKRKIPDDPKVIVSPADGVIKDIETVETLDGGIFPDNKALRVGIFLSIFDVHLNRAPCDMVVTYTAYKKGKFHDARNPKASQENESMLIAGKGNVDNTVIPIAVKQISGAIARRIICDVKINNSLKKGMKYGMIKFGSRTELFLPPSMMELTVKVGDRVYAGSSIMAKKKE